MLKNCDSSAIVAVVDLDRAIKFYSEVLGLERVGEASAELAAFRTGETQLIVYRSAEAGTNRANAVVWGCGDDLDAIVGTLEAKGVSFELYPEMPGIKIDGNVHVSGDMRLVWLTDPDGNILHLNNL